jgi:hypothetical protein
MSLPAGVGKLIHGFKRAGRWSVRAAFPRWSMGTILRSMVFMLIFGDFHAPTDALKSPV